MESTDHRHENEAAPPRLVTVRDVTIKTRLTLTMGGVRVHIVANEGATVARHQRAHPNRHQRESTSLLPPRQPNRQLQHAPRDALCRQFGSLVPDHLDGAAEDDVVVRVILADAVGVNCGPQEEEGDQNFNNYFQLYDKDNKEKLVTLAAQPVGAVGPHSGLRHLSLLPRDAQHYAGSFGQHGESMSPPTTARQFTTLNRNSHR